MSHNENFMIEQQKAVERMMEMNRRSVGNSGRGNMPPAPSFVKLPQRNDEKSHDSSTPQEDSTPQPKKFTSQTEGISLPFLNDLNLNHDTTLILGLLLILYSEKADRLLLMALLYILL